MKLYDADGIDGPFDRAMSSAMAEDRKSERPQCFRCHRFPADIPGLVERAEDDETSPDDFAREDGTYSAEHNTFACDDCYIAIGMPSRPGRGWTAPALAQEPTR